MERYYLIHFGNYEIKALRQIRQKVPVAYQSKIDEAILHSLNILSIIGPYVYFPTYSNSLKEIARYLKFDWSDRSSSGIQSLVWRQKWLQGERSYKDKLLQYNRDDCDALRKVTEFVETIISPETPSVSPIEAHFIHTSTLSKDKDQSALFGKNHSHWRSFQELMNAHISITNTTASLLVIARHTALERGLYEGPKIYREE